MSLKDLTYVNVRIPVVERHGALCVRVSDFLLHKNEVVHRILPKRKRVVVTAWGRPDFEISLVKISESERVDYSGSIGAWTERRGRVYAPISDLLAKLADYTSTFLLDAKRIVVTRFGWPEFAIDQPRWGSLTKIEYPSLVDFSAGPGEVVVNGRRAELLDLADYMDQTGVAYHFGYGDTETNEETDVDVGAVIRELLGEEGHR